MSERDSFICHECKEFIDTTYGEPMRNFYGHLFCNKCVKNLGLNDCEEFKDKNRDVKRIDDITKVNLNNEIVKCTKHPQSQAYYFCDKSMILYCKQCNLDNQLFKLAFGRDSAKIKLKAILENKLNSDYYENYNKKTWKNRLNGTAKEIYMCLLEIHFFDNPQPICLEHLNVCQFYDYQDFKFKCDLCPAKESTINYQQYKDNLVAHFLGLLRTANTASINSHISKALNNKIYEKDFFYAMNTLNSEKLSQITIGTCCFVCGTEFGFGKKLPVKLHDEPPHEICYTCFTTFKPTRCYLDSMNVYENLTIGKYQNLYKLKSRTCSIHSENDGTGKFSYYAHRLPYALCCNNCICESCKDAGKTTGGGVVCNNCGSSKTMSMLKKDETLVHQLKFLEVFCDTHQDQISNYYDSTNIKTYCTRCKQVPPKIRNEINPEKLDDALNKKLKEISIVHSQLFTEFLRAFQIYPLIVKLRANRFYESLVKLSQDSNGKMKFITEDTSLRFKKIQPALANAFMRWYLRRPKTYEVFISCGGLLELSGIIVGKAFSDNSLVTVRYNNFLIATAQIPRVFNEEYFENINFNYLIPINSTGILLQVEFSAGGYVHGSFRSLDPNFNFKGIPITVRSNDNCKDLERGGPLLGFSFSSFYISENEFP
ncbi:hypothetical protein SteCoe_19104 [Stentor coeruleus]|uniref:Uncharacterized protein n=1 Tax=Stentor coeruleus TaxID=5963 RepID=A0A1R2BUZ1_9CILI|nr:hypothetical protein SteCoe_19104 [Stentor coeruleus]